MTEIFCNLSLLKGCVTHRFNAFFHSSCLSHKSQHFLSNMTWHWSLIHRKFKSVPCPVAAKIVFQELNHVLEIPKFHISRQIPYLKNHLLVMKLYKDNAFLLYFTMLNISVGFICFLFKPLSRFSRQLSSALSSAYVPWRPILLTIWTQIRVLL